jgi:isopentenyl-diphosphate Delta-isomerase
MKEQTIIVNENDEIIGFKERSSLNKKDIVRISALWIQNSKGEILLAQRSFQKSTSPGKWGPAVAGTNEKGETYEQNMIKEAKEEIGLKGFKFEKAHKIRNKENNFVQWFTLKTDNYEFKLQKEEVEQVKWFKKEELKKEIKENPEKFTSSVKKNIDIFS